MLLALGVLSLALAYFDAMDPTLARNPAILSRRNTAVTAANALSQRREGFPDITQGPDPPARRRGNAFLCRAARTLPATMRATPSPSKTTASPGAARDARATPRRLFTLKH